MITEDERQDFSDRLFLDLIDVQFHYANASLAALSECLSGKIVASLVFFNIENFLNHTAKMSLILWPAASKSKARGERIRLLIGIEETHPLKNREARNHLQHFDERIDDWVRTDERLGYIDGNIGSRDQIFYGDSPAPVLRHFDPITGIFTFRSSEYDIRAIAQAVHDVKRKLDMVQRQGSNQG
ncbi:MAG: hypothetical protein K2X45_07540 [Phreatobacter sp.]|nr:hypothetical protein [Phreatobacter sp.]